MASPDIEERSIESEKNRRQYEDINREIIRRRVKVREISSKTECREKDEDAVTLDGKCSIKDKKRKKKMLLIKRKNKNVEIAFSTTLQITRLFHFQYLMSAKDLLLHNLKRILKEI
ncbi:uncharacterized protein [Centruroides vittatus]|uniref:uncharacterized protein n=1 Tax=Centruroides vittatus TaxID=120091 RepID=UPI00350F39AF